MGTLSECIAKADKVLSGADAKAIKARHEELMADGMADAAAAQLAVDEHLENIADELRSIATEAEAAGATVKRRAGMQFPAAPDMRSKNFKRWFKDSKVVDEAGNPLIVYHGTSDDFASFQTDHPNRKDHGWLGQGVYMTTDPALASLYAGNKKGEAGPSIMPLYASIQNPYYATQAEKERNRFDAAEADAFKERLMAAGYDGAIFDNGPGRGLEIVAYGAGQVKSFFNDGGFDPENPDILRQDAVPQLAVVHNLTADNLEQVLALGGLPAPSMAIIDTTKGDFNSFGEISLVAEPEILRGPKTRTFAADVYSPRHPSVINLVDMQAWRSFEGALEKAVEGYGMPMDLAMDTFEDMGAQHVESSTAVQLAYLQSIGKAPKPVKKEIDAADQPYMDMPHNSVTAYLEDPAVLPALEAEYEARLSALAEDKPNLPEKMRERWYASDGTLSIVTVEQRLQQIVRNKREGGIDRYQTEKAIRTAISKRGTKKKFEAWAKERARMLTREKVIYAGQTPMGKARTKPMTMDNIIRQMGTKVQGGESWNYGAGSIRAVYEAELKTLDDIRARADKLVTEEQENQMKEEANDRLMETLDALKPHYRYSAEGFRYYDDASTAIAEGAAAIRDAFEVNDEVTKLIGDLIGYLRALPTRYFEAKAMRPVMLSEFAYAAVPKGSSAKTIQALRDNGVRVKFYDKSKPGDRERVMQQLPVLFQEASRSDIGFYSAVEQAVLDLNIPQWKKGGKPMKAADRKALDQLAKDPDSDLATFTRLQNAARREQGLVQGPELWAKISKTPGVKAEELTWMGLQDYLGTQKDFTKEEVLTFVRANGVAVEDTMLVQAFAGEGDPFASAGFGDGDVGLTYFEAAERFDLEDMGANVRQDQEDWPVFYEETIADREVYMWEQPDGKMVAHYNGKNTEPATSVNEAEIRLRALLAEDGTLPRMDGVAKFGEYIAARDRSTDYRELLLRLPKHEETFVKSQHFEEQNVVAFARVTNTVANGARHYLVQEFQSDWHQQGSEHRYVPKDEMDALQLAYEAAQADLATAKARYFGLNGWWSGLPERTRRELYEALAHIIGPSKPIVAIGGKEGRGIDMPLTTRIAGAVDVSKRRDEFAPHIEKLPGGAAFLEAYDAFQEKNIAKQLAGKELSDARYGAPPAPFKNDAWINLMFKRVLRDAAERGETSFAWVDGDIIAARYEVDHKVKYDKKAVSIVQRLTGQKPRHVPLEGEEGGMWQIDLDEPLRESILSHGFPLFQDGDAAPRGWLSRREGGGFTITMAAGSDVSTFAHEAAHMFLEMERTLAEEFGQLPEHDAIFKMLGVNSFDEITREKHELFARSYEAYLMNGEAPVAAFKGIYRRFSVILVEIYKSMRRLNVNFSEEVKDTFDRLMFAEEELAAAAASPAYEELFRSAEQAGMNDKQWQEYNRRQEQREQASKEELYDRVLRELRARHTEDWKQEVELRAADFEGQLAEEPVYRAARYLENAPVEVTDVLSLYGVGAVMDLPPAVRNVMVGKMEPGGQDAEYAAEARGYKSAREMIDEISSVKPLKEAAKEMAHNAMVAENGDIFNDGTIEQEARDALHNEQHAIILMRELRALRLKAKRPMINRANLKAKAERTIGGMTYRQIQPFKYYRAEVRAAERAQAATDPAEQYDAKVEQLTNQYLFKEATKVKNRMAKRRKQIAKVQTRKYRTRDVHPRYIQNMVALARMYDMSKPNDRRQEASSLVEWYYAQVSDKNKFVRMDMMDPHLAILLAEKTAAAEQDDNTFVGEYTPPHFNDMTADAVEGVWAMIRQLRFVGGKMAEKERMEIVERQEELAASIREHGGRNARSQPGTTTKAEELYDKFSLIVNRIVSLRNLTRKLDGFQEGGGGRAFDYIFRNIERGNSRKIELNKQVYDKFREELSGIHRLGLGRKSTRKTYQLEGGEHAITNPNWRPEVTYTNEERLMLALYWGTETGREAVIDGFGFTHGDVQKILADLTVDELNTVNAIWRVNESMWPELSDASVKAFGVAPPKLDATPFVVNGVELTGGHMRLYYDDIAIKLDDEGKAIRERNQVQVTKAGSLYARIGSGGKAPQLEMGNIARSLEDSIHFISFSEVGQEVAAMINAKEVQRAVKDKHGEAFFKVLHETVSAVTSPPRREPGLGALNRRLRQAATFKYLAYSVRNTVQQFSGLVPTAHEIGPARYAHYMMHFANNYDEVREMVDGLSPFMRDRAVSVNREANTNLRQLKVTGQAGAMWETFKNYGFAPQSYVDGLISYPAWLAKFEERMEAHGDERRAVVEADTAISESVGSGQDLHLGVMLSSSQTEFMQMLTMFMSWFNAYYQRMYRSTEGYTKFTPEAFNTFVTVPLLTGTVAAVLVMDIPDEDSEEGWAEWTARQYVSFLGGTLPLVRDVVSYMMSGFGPKTPISGAVEAVGGIAGEYTAWEEGRQSGIKTVSDLGKAVTTVVAVPGSGNVWRALDYIDSAAEGREDRTGLLGGYQALVEGKDRND